MKSNVVGIALPTGNGALSKAWMNISAGDLRDEAVVTLSQKG